MSLPDIGSITPGTAEPPLPVLTGGRTNSASMFSRSYGSDENPWSGVLDAPPFIARHIQFCNRRNIIVSAMTLLLYPVLAFLCYEGTVHADDLRLQFICVIIAFAVPGWAIWNLIRSIKWQSRPSSHPALNWPALGDMGRVASIIDYEIARPDNHEKIGPALFTPTWLMRYNGWNVAAIPYQEIVWAYKKVTTHRTYGIATGKTYSMLLFASNGQNMTVNVPEAKVDLILNQIARRAPWAIMGYSDSLSATWKKNRAAFLKAVDERHASIRKQNEEKATQAANMPDFALDVPESVA